MTMTDPARILIVMGVSGAGKSTLGEALAARLGWEFQEGDALHPAANIAKMRSGQPLSDADRAPWLARIGSWIDAALAAERCGVVTCSALRRSYRERLADGRQGVVFVYLGADEALLRERLNQRHGHFMPPSLLASQLADLEAPSSDEAIVVPAALPLERQVDLVVAALVPA